MTFIEAIQSSDSIYNMMSVLHLIDGTTMTWLFMAQFGGVFVLVMSSRLLRDDRVFLAMANSWLITLTQFTGISIVGDSGGDPFLMFLVGGLGGSLGCGASYWFYNKFIMSLQKKKLLEREKAATYAES